MKFFICPDNDIVKNSYKNHGNFHAGDSGLDLFINEDIVVKPGETVKINLNIKSCALDDNGKPCSYLIYPRSSIVRTPLRLANSVGVIDRDYRGNLYGVFDNIKDFTYKIKKGDRLLQICAPDLSPITMVIKDELEDPGTRGEGGFGSTGR